MVKTKDKIYATRLAYLSKLSGSKDGDLDSLRWLLTKIGINVSLPEKEIVDKLLSISYLGKTKGKDYEN
jgi:hypothetical protein